MPPLPLLPRVLQALDRFHAARPWDHNAHYHRWILRQLPRRLDRALDVGAGTGELARRLAARARTVHGIDTDPAIVTRARELTDPHAPVVFHVGDARKQLPPGPYDAVTCVASIHHMPFAEALVHFRQQLAPGGRLVIVGLARAHSPADHLLGVVAIVLNIAMALIKNRGRTAVRPASMTARTRPAAMTFSEIARDARRVLPGARLRRRVFWRYTLVWQHS